MAEHPDERYHNEPHELLDALGVTERQIAEWITAHPREPVSVPAEVLGHLVFHVHSAHFGSLDMSHRACFRDITTTIERMLVEHAAQAIRTDRTERSGE